ncbi:hypothetical protein SRHO_G00203390 [Serrasalmus rhombeus]
MSASLVQDRTVSFKLGAAEWQRHFLWACSPPNERAVRHVLLFLFTLTTLKGTYLGEIQAKIPFRQFTQMTFSGVQYKAKRSVCSCTSNAAYREKEMVMMKMKTTVPMGPSSWTQPTPLIIT